MLSEWAVCRAKGALTGGCPEWSSNGPDCYSLPLLSNAWIMYGADAACSANCLSDVAKKVGANFSVPDVAVLELACGQPKVQDHEVLLRHDDDALAKGPKSVVAVVGYGCMDTGLWLITMCFRPTLH